MDVQVPDPVQAVKARPAAREDAPAAEPARRPAAAVRPPSTSALLQRRSENAVAVRAPVSPAASEADVDSKDKLNERAAAEYVGDIFEYFRRVEPQYRVSPAYMSRQVCYTTRPTGCRPVPSIQATVQRKHACDSWLGLRCSSNMPCSVQA